MPSSQLCGSGLMRLSNFGMSSIFSILAASVLVHPAPPLPQPRLGPGPCDRKGDGAELANGMHEAAGPCALKVEAHVQASRGEQHVPNLDRRAFGGWRRRMAGGGGGGGGGGAAGGGRSSAAATARIIEPAVPAVPAMPGRGSTTLCSGSSAFSISSPAASAASKSGESLPASASTTGGRPALVDQGLRSGRRPRPPSFRRVRPALPHHLSRAQGGGSWRACRRAPRLARGQSRPGGRRTRRRPPRRLQQHFPRPTAAQTEAWGTGCATRPPQPPAREAVAGREKS